jgi:hypothetical protein
LDLQNAIQQIQIIANQDIRYIAPQPRCVVLQDMHIIAMANAYQVREQVALQWTLAQQNKRSS